MHRTSQVNALKWKRCDNTYDGQTLPEKCGGRSIPNSFCEATITMNQNEAEMPHRKENYRLTSLMNINTKILRKIVAKTKQKHMKRIIHQVQVGFIPGMQRFFTMCKSINVVHYINKLKDKNHMIISINAEKGFDKIKHQFMI